MSNSPLSVFVEKLIQFYLDKSDVTWQPSPRVGQIEDSPIVFYEAIGYAVMRTPIEQRSIVRKHTTAILNLIFHERDRVGLQRLNLKITEVALDIYRSDNLIQSTFTFLTVMVDVSAKCAVRGEQPLIQEFVRIIPHILNLMLPNGFLPNFSNILMHARSRPQPAP